MKESFICFLVCFCGFLMNEPSVLAQSKNSQVVRLEKYEGLIQSKNFPAALKLLNLEENQPSTREDLARFFAHFHYHRGLNFRENKNYSRSLEDLESALEFEPGKPEIILALSEVYLEDNQAFESIHTARTVLDRLDGDLRIRAHRSIARAQARLQDYVLSMQGLNNALLRFPGNSNLLEDLALVQMKAQDYRGSLDSLLKLEEIKPLTEALSRVKNQALKALEIQDNYSETFSSSFHVLIQDRQYERFKGQIVSILESIYLELGEIFHYFPRGLTRVLFLTETDFHDLTQTQASVAGVSDGASLEIRIPLGRVNRFSDPKQLKDTLYHEYTHHLIRLLTGDHPSIPSWFHEGMASYMEPSGPRMQAREILLDVRKQKQLLGPEAGETNPLTHPDSKAFYVQARSLMEFLEGQGHIQDLIDNLPRLRGTIRFDDIFLRSTHQSIEKFFSNWKIWVQTLNKSRPSGGKDHASR